MHYGKGLLGVEGRQSTGLIRSHSRQSWSRENRAMLAGEIVTKGFSRCLRCAVLPEAVLGMVEEYSGWKKHADRIVPVLPARKHELSHHRERAEIDTAEVLEQPMVPATRPILEDLR